MESSSKQVLSPGNMCLRFQVPVNVAMKEPRSSIVSHETQSYIIFVIANVDSIPSDGVNKIIRCSPGYFHNIEGVLHGSQFRTYEEQCLRTPCIWNGC